MATKNAQNGRNLAPVKLELLITVVRLSRVQYYSNIIQSMDVNFLFTAQGIGTSKLNIIDLLGLNQTTKGIIFCVVREDRLPELMETLQEKFRTVKEGRGVSVAVPLSSVIGRQIYGFLSNDQRTVKE